MKISEVQCKTALSRSGIYGWTYTVNPYRGCMHGCRYCYSPNILKLPRSNWGEYVEVKNNIPVILAKELKRIDHIKLGLVGLSSVTDPYQILEEKYKLTRYCLEQLLRYRFPVSIITKSPLIIRDIDLLKEFSYSEITVTITTLDEKLAHILEPGAPAISKRLQALEKMNSEGLNTYAFLGPLLPILEQDQVVEFTNTILETGVKTVMVDTLNLKPGIWSDLENALNNEPRVKNIFHERLFEDKNYYKHIFSSIKSECEAKGIKFD